MAVSDFLKKHKVSIGFAGTALVLVTAYGSCEFTPTPPEEDAPEEPAPESEEPESEEPEAEPEKEEAPDEDAEAEDEEPTAE